MSVFYVFVRNWSSKTIHPFVSKQLKSSLRDPPKNYSDKAETVEEEGGGIDSAGIREGAIRVEVFELRLL